MEERVKIILIEQPFLRILAQYYIEKFTNYIPDFSRTLFIFPSERNKFYFRRYLLEVVNKKGIIPPEMFTIEELTNFIYEKSGGEKGLMLNNTERNFILKKTIDELKIQFLPDLPFLKFIAIGDRLLNFFDELAQEGVELDEIEEKSIELHFPERYVKNELLILNLVFKRYQKNLLELGYRDPIDKFKRLYEGYDPNIFSDFDYICIAGLIAPTKLEMRIIKNMFTDLNTELILHSGHPKEVSLSKEPDKRFYLHYKFLNYLGLDITKIETIGNSPSAKPVIHIKSLDTFTKQTFYLDEVISQAIKRYQEPHRIGVILTDESILFPVVEILNVRNIEYNLSAGLPFVNLLFYSFLEHLLNTLKNNNHYSEFFVFIQHPLIKNAVINDVQFRPLIYRMMEMMREKKINYFEFPNNEIQLKLDGMESEFQVFINFLKRCFNTVQAKLKLSEYIDNLLTLLNDLLSYNQGLIKMDYPGLKEFFDELHNLGQLRIKEDGIQPGIEMLEFIMTILKSSKYHIQGKPLRGVQIIGVLEARNLDFDCVILPSFNEGIFPRKSEKDMFLNPALRKELGLPTSQERDNLYYYYFTQLINGKKEVYISYIEEEEKDIPSRFISILEIDGYHPDKSRHDFIQSSLKIVKREIKKEKNLMEELLNRITRKGLSPDALKKYRTCPYKFYLSYLIGIKEIKAIPEEFDPLLWGDLFHSVVSEFYRDYYPSGFTDDEIEEAFERFKKILHYKIDSEKYLSSKPKPVTYFDLEIYTKYIKKFLENEAKRFADGFRPVTKNLEKKITRSIELEKRSILIMGYVDRIDVKDEEYYIIDYKTGTMPRKRDWVIGEDFIEFQLPLYALIFSGEDNKIGGLMYYKIGREIEIYTICEKSEVTEYLNRFKDEILIPTIKEIIDPNIPFSPTNVRGACRYCDYSKLCGRGVDGGY
uniref:PD-(D/E)XK nuclease family protein n=1 Tax=candidate division WOR-3 bacterium TaxID=2052148 RepID=A0A7C4TER7_UNCW3